MLNDRQNLGLKLHPRLLALSIGCTNNSEGTLTFSISQCIYKYLLGLTNLSSETCQGFASRTMIRFPGNIYRRK